MPADTKAKAAKPMLTHGEAREIGVLMDKLTEHAGEDCVTVWRAEVELTSGKDVVLTARRDEEFGGLDQYEVTLAD